MNLHSEVPRENSANNSDAAGSNALTKRELHAIPEAKAPWTEAVTKTEAMKMATITADFFGEEGHWRQLMKAANSLRSEVAALYFSKDSTTKPHRNDLGNTYRDYLYGDKGLHGELANSLAQIYEFYFAPKAPFANAHLTTRLAEFCRAFDQQSELSNAAPQIASRTNAITPGFDQGNNPEPKRLALFRAANVIEQWLEHNKNRIEPEKRQIIKGHLATYRNELASTLGFVNKAKEFLAEQQRAASVRL